MIRGLLIAAAVCATPLPALAQAQADPRIQVVDYDPDRVVRIRGALGYQLSIEFGADERIENVSIGDALAWQVTPNRRANILFLKPTEASATNMTVVTDARRYVFDLEVQPRAATVTAPYTVRFVYPVPAVAMAVETAPEPEAPPRVANAAYSVTGSKESSPVRVFDDGQMTYFEWPEDGAMPAVFAVAADGSESIVNFFVRGKYIVVEQLGGRFVLRNGPRVATVVNTAYPVETTRRSRR